MLKDIIKLSYVQISKSKCPTICIFDSLDDLTVYLVDSLIVQRHIRRSLHLLRVRTHQTIFVFYALGHIRRSLHLLRVMTHQKITSSSTCQDTLSSHFIFYALGHIRQLFHLLCVRRSKSIRKFLNSMLMFLKCFLFLFK